MRRIGLAVILAVGLALAPLTVKAQQTGKVPRIGVLVPVEPESPTEPNIRAFRQTLHDLGYVNGQNVVVEYRYAHGKAELYPELASELVRLQVDVMVVGSWDPTLAAKRATKTVPIVGVGMGSDPVAIGIVSSFARPGGNVTGSSFLTGAEFAGKYVELLKEVAPQSMRVAYLRDPRGRVRVPVTQRTSQDAAEAARTAALSLGLTFQMVEASELTDVESALAKMSGARGSTLIVEGSLFFMRHASEITKLTAKYRLPAIYGVKEAFMDAGGLMAYGPSLAHLWERAAIYADKILKGAKPGDLPVEQPTKFDLIINLKTAKAIGLTIPPSLLQRADQVIE